MPLPPPRPRAPAPAPGAPSPGTVPAMPGRKVKFRHPDTGEETQGHLHATGPVGATVVDGRGAVHKVPHGHYMHADEAGPGQGDPQDGKPSAAVVKKAAMKHLELGADQPLAVYAAAALLSKKLGGVEHAHDLKSEEVTIANPYARVERGKLQTDLEPLVKTLAALKKKTASGPLFVVDGKPITADALTLYVQRFGTPGKGVGGRDVRPANPGDGEPMAKAAATKWISVPAFRRKDGTTTKAHMRRVVEGGHHAEPAPTVIRMAVRDLTATLWPGMTGSLDVNVDGTTTYPGSTIPLRKVPLDHQIEIDLKTGHLEDHDGGWIVDRIATGGQRLGSRQMAAVRNVTGDGEPMAKAAASALDLPVLGEAESEWEHLGYHCSFHKGDHGLGHLMIEGPNMPLPLHEVVGNAIAARAVASLVVANLRAGKAPGRGVFQATR